MNQSRMRTATHILAAFMLVVLVGLNGCNGEGPIQDDGPIGAAVQRVTTNCPFTNENQRYFVCVLATSGSGTYADPWRGWESSVNSTSAGTDTGGGAEIYFSAGYYYQYYTINVKTGWTIRGDGEDASIIYSGSTYAGGSSGWASTYGYTSPQALTNTGSSTIPDAIQYLGTSGSATDLSLRVEDLSLWNPDSSTTNAGIDNMGGYYSYIDRVRIYGFAYGIVLDQAELATIDHSDMEAFGVGGIWIANGPDHNGWGAGGTDSIVITNTHFAANPSSSRTAGIIDDGGVIHTISTNVFFGYEWHGVFLSGTNSVTIRGNDFEVAREAIEMSHNNFHGTANGNSANFTIADNTFSMQSTYHAVYDLYGSNGTLNNNLVAADEDAFATSTASDGEMIYAIGNVVEGLGGAPPNLFSAFTETASGSFVTDLISNANGYPITPARVGVGAGTLHPYATLDVAGTLALRSGPPSTLVPGLNSNIALNAHSYIHISSSVGGNFSLGGFCSLASCSTGPSGTYGGADGQILTVYNASGYTMTIVNGDSSTQVDFKIKTLTGANVALSGASAASFIYDWTDLSWILLSTNG